MSPQRHERRADGHAVANMQAVYDRHPFEAEMLAAFEALAREIERVVHPLPPNVVQIRSRAKAGRRK